MTNADRSVILGPVRATHIRVWLAVWKFPEKGRDGVGRKKWKDRKREKRRGK
jgi:hypothetical protein